LYFLPQRFFNKTQQKSLNDAPEEVPAMTIHTTTDHTTDRTDQATDRTDLTIESAADSLETRKSSRAESTTERLLELLGPVLANVHLELVDVVVSSLGTSQATVQVLVDHAADHPLGGRIDLDGVSAATKIVDETIEANDPVEGAFTLEVSSPGLERPLRTPQHFVRFQGTTISVKTTSDWLGDRRIEGRLVRASSEIDGTITIDGATVDGTEIPYSVIDRARTVFVWGPQPKPGSKPGAKAGAKTSSKTSRTPAANHKQTSVQADVDHEEEQ
jgi:ribosome maturation factor RimP